MSHLSAAATPDEHAVQFAHKGTKSLSHQSTLSTQATGLSAQSSQSTQSIHWPQGTQSWDMSPQSYSNQSLRGAQGNVEEIQAVTPAINKPDARRLKKGKSVKFETDTVQNPPARQQALDHLVGTTSASPLRQITSDSLLLASYDQSLSGDCGVSFPIGRPASATSIATTRLTECGEQEPTIKLGRFRVRQPVIGQKYRVCIVKSLCIRKNLAASDINPEVGYVNRDDTVRILQYSVTPDQKLRALVLTQGDQIGWCTMLSDDGILFLKLESEYV